MDKTPINIFWFRRDLRLSDNPALTESIKDGLHVLCIFIFDEEITMELNRDDPRITLIYDSIKNIDQKLRLYNSGLKVLTGKPQEIFSNLLREHNIQSLFFNRDYEPYALKRDKEVTRLLSNHNIEVKTFRDHVIFEPGEIVKSDDTPYSVYTAFKNKWKVKLSENYSRIALTGPISGQSFYKTNEPFPDIKKLCFERSKVHIRNYDFSVIENYHLKRDFPSEDSGSYVGPYLRFGIISPRKLIKLALDTNETYLNELIWREFFIQILYHYPDLVSENFRKKYDKMEWRNDPEEFELWKKGMTGYPLVDAGMRQLKQSGYMHNRVRMVAASFLTKHLLIDWRWGESWFAKNLLDFELASNNGNWQWVAGSGCDAAPYFRIFNPVTQQEKFDKNENYIKKWIPEFGTSSYPEKIVEHKFARERALNTYHSLRAET